MTTSTFTEPGVYFNESLNTPPAASGVSLSNCVFIGPINRGPLGLTLVTGQRVFDALYGGFQAGTTPSDLELAVWLFFQRGGGQCYIQRVPDGHEVAASASNLDVEPVIGGSSAPRTTLTFTAVNPGTWGNALSYTITPDADVTRFVLTTYISGVQAERFESLTMDMTDPKYVVNVINATNTGSSLVNVTDANVAVSVALRTPAFTGTGSGTGFVASPVVLVGGVDASGAPSSGAYDTALSQVSQVAVPVQMNLPGIVDGTLISKALVYCENRGDAFLVIDGTTGVNATVTAQISQLAQYAGNNGPSSYGAAYFPRIVVKDPSAVGVGGTRVVAPGGAVMAVYAGSDAANGIQKAPAGLSSRIGSAIGLEVPLSDTDLGNLNANQINAIRSYPGAGIVIMGARTLTTTGLADKYISVRRSLIYVKAQAKQLLSFALFEDNDQLLWAQMSSLMESFLLEFYQQGGLAGATAGAAFYVICDATNNTAVSIAQGVVNMEIGCAFERPAEFITITVNQIDGSTNLSESVNA